MSKLTLDALTERAKATASNELLESISGGTENACHDTVMIATKAEIDGNCLAPLYKWIMELF
ncbi:hypothetical protein [Flavobacterium tructae]|uniref:hypothetical protein n=1 Tax=Flavobacterium tructae TaxID=1114873 RepID=UPI0035A9A786